MYKNGKFNKKWVRKFPKKYLKALAQSRNIDGYGDVSRSINRSEYDVKM